LKKKTMTWRALQAKKYEKEKLVKVEQIMKLLGF
jgi:hypothetical protein